MARFRGVELSDLTLRGPRLLLRPWLPSDADRVHEVMQSPAMHDYLALPDPYTEADAAAYLGGLAQQGRAAGTGLGCAMVEPDTGRVVGSADLRLSDEPNLGYWVAPDAQGHGYAAEASRLLAGWAFGVGLGRVGLDCDVRNLASARTALAAGFLFEGISRRPAEPATGTGTGTGTAAGTTTETATGTAGADLARRADHARFARLATDPPAPIAPAFAPLPPGGLSDATVRLRAVAPQDGPAFAETDDELTLRWNFTGTGHSPQEADLFAAAAGLNWLVGGTASIAVIDEATDRLAGVVNLRKAGPPQVGGIGYVVHPAFRGRGYTARALRLLIPWAFEVADFARLELGAKEGNLASLRAAAAAGFEPDGVRRRRLRNADATFSDEVRYALINPRYA